MGISVETQKVALLELLSDRFGIWKYKTFLVLCRSGIDNAGCFVKCFYAGLVCYSLFMLPFKGSSAGEVDCL